MNFAELLEPYRIRGGNEAEGLTPEFQVRWLKRMGFSKGVITRSMIAVYTEIQKAKDEGRDRFADWKELQTCLKATAVVARNKEEVAEVKEIQKFVQRLRKEWELETPWYKRMVGIKRRRETT